MSDVLDRFLRYVRYDTQSDETSTTFPSTDKQLILLRALTNELRRLALADPSPEMPGVGVAPIVHRGYDGRDLVLPDDPTAVLRLRDNPALADQMGHDIVTASAPKSLGA